MYFPKDGWTFTFELNDLFSNKKKSNRAPKTIKGDYDLSIHGNKIVLVDNVDGTTVEAKCSPQDNFDIGEGIKEAFKKLNEEREKGSKEIKIGDIVEVIYPGKCYPTLSNYFKKNNLTDFAPFYRYGVVPVKGIKGRVIFTDSSHVVFEVFADKSYGDKEYSESDCQHGIYIVNQDGLKKVKE